MIIFIPIPIGTRHVATVRGSIWKLVSCSRCQSPYAYELEIEATGEAYDLPFVDGQACAELARENAEQNLMQKGQNIVLPVPCPNCGFYQDDMARQLKEDARINTLQIVGAVITFLCPVPLAFGITWVLTLMLAILGVGLLAYGYVVAFRFDPNAGDPAPRKAEGRRRAVWGEQLAGMLAASAEAAQDIAPKAPPPGAPARTSLN